MSEAAQLVAELRHYVADERVLRAIERIPREAFVPDDLRPHAYDNTALGIGCGQTISQPLVVARMTELLELRPDDRVLDVGTGSGYHAAILAALTVACGFVLVLTTHYVAAAFFAGILALVLAGWHVQEPQET